MPLRRSGVDLVIKGFSDFISKLGRVETSYSKTGDAAARLKSRVDSAAVAQQNAARRVENAQRALDNAQRAVIATTSKLAEAQARLRSEMADGKIEADKLGKMTNQIAALENQLADQTNRQATALNNLATASANAGLATQKLTTAQTQYADAQQASQAATQGTLSTILNVSPALASLGQVGIALGAALGVAAVAFKGLQMAASLAGNVLSTVYGVIKGFVSGAINLFQGFIGILERVTRPLRTFAGHVLEIFTGISLANFFQSVSEGLSNMTGEVFDAVAGFQRLEIQLESLSARDYARATGVSMAEAFQQVSGAAQQVFDWMRKLAVTTPFEVGDISRTYAMAQAMGLTTTQSSEVTKAIINFTSAMGLTDEVMYRIIYNFGQMIQRGKLSGEEFRDLARNFVPIDDIMKNMSERAGMTKEAFRELALKGGIPVNDFLQEFINMANQDFPDAAAKMARTWEGVTNNVKDFLNAFVGFDVIKPVMDRFTSIVAGMLDKVLNDKTLQNSTKLLGQTLLAAFETLIPAVDMLVDAIGGLFESFGLVNKEISVSTYTMGEFGSTSEKVYSLIRGLAVGIMTVSILIKRGITAIIGKINDMAGGNKKTFSDMVKDAWDWGLNFMDALAKGIAAGIRLVTAVIKTIAGVLKAWFGPGSPPAVAPEIDQWGANAMNEFLHGFTLADFSMFGDIADLVQSYIESIGTQIGEVNVIPAILQARSGIASAIQAVRAGAISAADAVNEMVSAIGVAQSDFSFYISSLFAVAEAERQVEVATKAVEAAQQRINDITARYNVILTDLRNQLTDVTETFEEENRLAEIEAAIATGRLTAEEKARLENEKRKIQIERQIRAVEAQQEVELSQAELALQQAEAEQAAAEARLKYAQEQARIAEEQIRLMIEQNNLLNEQAELIKKLQEELEKTNEEAQELQPEIPDFGALGEFTDLQFNLDQMWAEANRLADELMGNIGELSNIFQTSGLGSSIDSIKTAFSELIGIIPPLTGDDGLLAKIGTAWDKFRNFLGIPADVTFVEWVLEKIQLLGERLAAMWKIGGILLAPLGASLSYLGSVLVTNAKVIFEGFQSIAEGIGLLTEETKPGGGIEVLKFLSGWALSPFILTINSISMGLLLAGAAFEFFANKFKEGMEKLRGIADSIKTITDILTGDLPTPQESAKAFLNLPTILSTIKTIAGVLLGDINGLFFNFMRDLLDRWINLDNELVGNSIIPDMMAAIKSVISTVLSEIKTEWNTSVDEMKEKARTFSDIASDINTSLTEMATVGIPTAVRALVELGNAFMWAVSQSRDLATELATLSSLYMTVSVTGGSGATPMQSGGAVSAGTPYLVGEKRPEVFVPNASGTIIPSVASFLRGIESGLSGSAVSAMPIIVNQTIDNSVHVEINPSYKNVQSEASIAYDVQAALASVWR